MSDAENFMFPSMRNIRFRVANELPPKKDGANSMWGKRTEAPRLIALRKAALEALGDQRPFTQEIRLTLRVHVGLQNDLRSGDLDNFITGVCDGLMASAPRSSVHPLFDESENSAVHPSKTIAVADDFQIMKIDAEKLAGLGEDHWYEIKLEGK